MLLLPLLSSAEEVRIGGLWYNLISKGKVAEVIQDNGDGIYYGDIVIPDKVTYEDVEYSVTSIGGSAFYNCSGLTSVIIGDNVTSIGDNAFYCCESLTSLSIPSGLTSIGRYTFYQCNALTSVHITDLTAWCNIYFSHQYSNPLSCAHHLFINGEEIKDLVIPNSVTTIKKVAFFGFSGMTSISISNSVTSIGDAAFHSCI